MFNHDDCQFTVSIIKTYDVFSTFFFNNEQRRILITTHAAPVTFKKVNNNTYIYYKGAESITLYLSNNTIEIKKNDVTQTYEISLTGFISIAINGYFEDNDKAINFSK